MRKRVWGLLGLVLAMGAAARAQVVQEKQLIASNMLFTQDGKKLLATVAQKHKATGKFSPWALMSWDVESGRELSRTLLPDNTFPRLLVSPDGRLFYGPKMQGEGPKPILRDTATGQPVCTLELTAISVSPQAFSADGKLLAANGQISGVLSNPTLAENVSLWDITKFYDTGTGKQVPLFVRESVSERLSTTLFSQDNRQVVRIGTKSGDGENSRPWVVVFDRHTGQRLRSFFIERKNLRDYELSPDGQYLVGIPKLTGNKQSPTQVPLWSIQSGALLHLLTLKPDYLTSFRLHFSADSTQLTAFVSTWDRNYMYINPGPPYTRQSWATASGQELSHSRLPFESIYHNALRPTLTLSTTNDRLFARVTNKNSIQLYDQESGKLLWEMEIEI